MKLFPTLRQKNETSTDNRKPFWRPEFFLGLLIAGYLLAGLALVTRYGETVDDPHHIYYAYLSLHAYSGRMEDLRDEKGVFYNMVQYLGAEGLQRVFPGWKFIDGWHYMNFLAFVVGIYFFYRLCRRFIQPIPALAATLLFGTQPLLWGHAFINPKDIPFMSFFLGSVTLGLEMVDHYPVHPAPALDIGGPQLRQLTQLPSRFAAEWKSSSRRQHSILASLTAALIGVAASIIPIRLGIAWLVERAYQAPASTWLGGLFQRAALHSRELPVESYVIKAQTLHIWASVGVVIGLLAASIWVARSVFPSTVGGPLRFLAQPRVLLAGCFLGFVSAIRTLGPASGLLVIAYFLAKAGRRAIPAILEYLAVGALITCAFWPYLWANPLQNYLEALNMAANYPWLGSVLFGGVYYPNQKVPAGYLPTLLGLQFTEAALALFLAGLVLASIYLGKRAVVRLDLLLLGAWFFPPVVAVILLHSTIYNNFRQFLFVVPPLFIVAGLPFQALWERLKHRVVLFAAITALALLPAFYWNFRLDPYEYIYYNSLAGGMSGAFHNYENDYWIVSFKEAIEYINRVAARNATVYIKGIDFTTKPYARPDLQLDTSRWEITLHSNELKNGYAILPANGHENELLFPVSPVIYQIERDGNILAVVKQVAPGDVIASH